MYRTEEGGILLPEPSRATRDVTKASKGHQSGSLVIRTRGAEAGRIVRVESGLEGQVLNVLAGLPGVVDIEEQPPAVEYAGLDGRTKRKTFDFRVTLDDGSRVAVEVKPAAIAARTKLLDELRCLARSMPSSFADSIRLITDDDVDPVARYNAGTIQRYSREADPEADDKAAALAADLNGAVEIQAAVTSLGLGHRGFGAVVRLIARRRLQLVQHERITYRAVVKSVEARR